MNECKVCGVKIEKGKRLCAECEAQVAVGVYLRIQQPIRRVV